MLENDTLRCGTYLYGGTAGGFRPTYQWPWCSNDRAGWSVRNTLEQKDSWDLKRAFEKEAIPHRKEFLQICRHRSRSGCPWVFFFNFCPLLLLFRMRRIVHETFSPNCTSIWQRCACGFCVWFWALGIWWVSIVEGESGWMNEWRKGWMNGMMNEGMNGVDLRGLSVFCVLHSKTYVK